MSNPQYAVEDTVYLSESALGGHIESYVISEVRQGTDAIWYYRICVPARSPNAQATMGDRITHGKNFDFYLTEDQLCSYCEAIDLAITHTESKLTYLQGLKASHCEETGGSE